MPQSWDQAASGDSARLSALIGPKKEARPDKPSRDEDEEKRMFFDVRKLRTQYLDYLESKVDEIEEQKESQYPERSKG